MTAWALHGSRTTPFIALLACGGGSVSVPSHPHPAFAPAEIVTSLPPPAQIEHLDATPPLEGCLWAGGQWEWNAQRWDWRPGGWIRAPEGCRYSAPSAVWSESAGAAVLYYRPGGWYSVTEPEICKDPVSCTDNTAQKTSPPLPRDR
jgi:hypothetical protein